MFAVLVRAMHLTARLAILAAILLAVTLTRDGAVAQVPVSGIIASDTTWLSANSPYIVTADVIVAPGVTLTIEPGVEVRFDSGTKLWVKGTLSAVGADAQRIVFTRNGASAWSGIRVDAVLGGAAATATIDYGLLEGATSALETTGQNSPILNVSNSLIRDNGIGVTCGHKSAWFVSYNRFLNNSTAALWCDTYWTDLGGQVDHNEVSLNGLGLFLGQGGPILWNTVTGNTGTGIVAESGPIEYNLVSDNNTGLLVRSADVRFNTITDNASFGVIYSGNGIRLNNICGNEGALANGSAVAVDATDNFWGTTDSAAIAAAINDFYDNPGRGIVTFQPFLVQPVPEAPSEAPGGSGCASGTQAVGGIAELPAVDGAALGAGASPGPNAGVVAGIVAAAIAGALALGVAGWYRSRSRPR